MSVVVCIEELFDRNVLKKNQDNFEELIRTFDS